MSNKIVQPYVFFDGKCEKAIEFYKHALGAQVVMLMRFNQSPEPPPPGCGPVDGNKIMHAQFQIGSTMIIASDGRATGHGLKISLAVVKQNGFQFRFQRVVHAEANQKQNRRL